MWAVLGELVALCPHHHHQLQEEGFPCIWQEQGKTKTCVRLSEDELAHGEGCSSHQELQEPSPQQHFFCSFKTLPLKIRVSLQSS